MTELRGVYGPTSELYFITGADAVWEILTWKDAERLADLTRLIAATRPGYDLSRFASAHARAAQAAPAVEFMEVPALAISSTDIRERVAREDGPSATCCRRRSPPTSPRTACTGGRVIAPTYDGRPRGAAAPARRQGPRALRGGGRVGRRASPRSTASIRDVARLAGLLHDWCKEAGRDELLAAAQRLGIEITTVDRVRPSLLHGPVGAAELAESFPGLSPRDPARRRGPHLRRRAT